MITTTRSCDVKNNNNQKSLNGDYPGFDQFFKNIENFRGNALFAINGKSIYSKCFGYASRELLVKTQ